MDELAMIKTVELTKIAELEEHLAESTAALQEEQLKAVHWELRYRLAVEALDYSIEMLERVQHDIDQALTAAEAAKVRDPYKHQSLASPDGQ